MKGEYVHPLPVRLWHWLNALGFLILLMTGTHMRFYHQIEWIPYLVSRDIHNWTGVFVIGNYFTWFFYYLFSDRISSYHPVMSLKIFYLSAISQIRYYMWDIFKGGKNPHNPTPKDKFNTLQRTMYQIIMLIIVPIQFITGCVLWKPLWFSGWIEIVGEYKAFETVHVMTYIALVAFVSVHLYLITLGKTKLTHIKEMMTGYVEEH